jgi:transporter family protein
LATARDSVLLYCIVAVQVLGYVSLSRGMRRVGGLDALTPHSIQEWIVRIATNPWIALGAIFMILFLVFYLEALSRLDLTFVMPITASSYILTALLAWLLLGEKVPYNRWAGTVLVSFGILFVNRSERRRAARDQ